VELAGLQSEGRRPLDGVSFAPALRGHGPPPTARTLFVHSQRVEHPEKWRKSAVMTGRWRLVNGAELYDMGADPGQEQDVAREHSEVVARLRGAYDAWWDSLVPVFDQYVRIGVGGPDDPTELMSHDWHTEGGPVPWNQSHVRDGLVSNGTWAIEVERAGEYEFTLRRWPAHLERPMDSVRAAIAFGGVEEVTNINSSAVSASFRIRLPAGPTELLTTLRRSSGEEHGAYFVSVRWVGQ